MVVGLITHGAELATTYDAPHCQPTQGSAAFHTTTEAVKAQHGARFPWKRKRLSCLTALRWRKLMFTFIRLNSSPRNLSGTAQSTMLKEQGSESNISTTDQGLHNRIARWFEQP